MKTCNLCKVAYEDLATNFDRHNKTYKSGKIWQGWDYICKACKKVKNKQNNLKNKDKYNESKKAWKSANPEKVKASRLREYANRDKDKTREAYRKHYEANKTSYAVKAAARKARKKCASKATVEPQAVRQFYIIARLLTDTTGIVHEVDHIDPLTHPLVCGLHVPANLRITTLEANRIKHNTFKPYGFDGWYYDL